MSIIAQAVRHLNRGGQLPADVTLKQDGEFVIVIKTAGARSICCGVLAKRSAGYFISGFSAINDVSGWRVMKRSDK